MAIPTLEQLGALDPPKTNDIEQEQERVQEIDADTQEVQEAAKTSLDFLAALAMPLVYAFAFPALFISAWQWLLDNTNKQRAFPQLALGLPRGFAKTTVIKLYVLFCILYTNKKFILIIGATATLAENILSDIIDMLEEPNIKTVFGDWKLGAEKDTQSVKKFGFRGRNINMVALGAGGSLRGLNLKNERPDVMIFDDIQTREDADSQVISENLEKWMYGTAMKAKSPFGCVFIFLGNMYPTRWSILKKLKKNPNWVKFIVGGVLSNGSSLWEALQPIEQLIKEFINDYLSGHPEIFYAEVLNDEDASININIDLNSLPTPRYAEGDIAAGKFIVIDPSTHKATADNVAIGYFEIHDTYPMLMEVVEEQLSPLQTIHKALALAIKNQCSLIAIESNAYQATLCFWFEHICNQLGLIGIEAVEVYSGVSSKNARILKMFRSYQAGEIFVHEKARPHVHQQIRGFNAMKTDNIDNTLDLLTYAQKVIELYGEFVISNNIINIQELGNVRVRNTAENSAF